MTAASSSLDGLHDPEALPPLTDVNRPYFAAAARGVLVFQRCANGHPFLYPRLVCPVCHDGELAWETAAGTGEIVSFAPVYRPPWDSFRAASPTSSCSFVWTRGRSCWPVSRAWPPMKLRSAQECAQCSSG